MYVRTDITHMAFLLVMTLVSMSILAYEGVPQKHIDHPFNSASQRKLPCPNPDDIQPCICTVIEDYLMRMDCSNVTSEAELEQVFKTDFPFTSFHKLEINNNENVQVLQPGVFGNASFEVVEINNCVLNTIEVDAFKKSHSTLQSLTLNGNNLTLFTMDDMIKFPNLFYVSLQSNPLQEFPLLSSSSLRILILDSSPFGSIPVEALVDLEALEVLSVQDCGISQISSGSFTTSEKLEVLHLGSNRLSSVPHGAIVLHGANSQLSLFNNQIGNIHLDSFSGVEIFLDMKTNSLSELKEEAWRPLLENNVYLTLEDNPFKCGCDIAWLILNRTLLDRVAGRPTCSDGEAFVELDPNMYEALC